MKTKKKKTLIWKMEKHYRWFRRYWFCQYLKRVKITEAEIGGEIYPC